MSKLEIIAPLRGVVYKVKSTGPITEPRGTLYESVTLSDRVSLIFTIGAYFANKKKAKLSLARYSIPTIC